MSPWVIMIAGAVIATALSIWSGYIFHRDQEFSEVLYSFAGIIMSLATLVTVVLLV